jgi:Porin subfamily
MARLRNVLALAATVSAFTLGAPTFASARVVHGNDPCAGLRGISYLDCQRAVAATRAAARWQAYQRKLEAGRARLEELFLEPWERSGLRPRSGPRPILYEKRATCFYYIPGTDTCVKVESRVRVRVDPEAISPDRSVNEWSWRGQSVFDISGYVGEMWGQNGLFAAKGVHSHGGILGADGLMRDSDIGVQKPLWQQNGQGFGFGSRSVF